MDSRNEETRQGELLKWNYTADLDLLKKRFPRIAQSDMGKARNLLMALLNLTENSTLEHESASHSEGLSKQGSDSGEPYGKNRNPLDIPLILNEVLSYLPVNFLLNCRLVNKTWNSIAVSWIRQKCPIVRVHESHNFHRLCAAFEECDLLPFSSLDLKLPGENLEKIEQFFIQHGSSVKSLTLEKTILNLESRMALGTIFKYVPNLKALCCWLDPEEYTAGTTLLEPDETIQLKNVEYLKLVGVRIPLHKEFLDQLFALIPNLKIARIFANSRQDFQLLAQAMQKLNLTSLHSPFPHHLQNPGSGQFWKSIAGSQKQKLKELVVQLESRGNRDLELLIAQGELLSSQSESLEVLTIWNQTTPDNSNASVALRFPVMNNLRILQLGFLPTRGYSIPLLVPIEPYQVPRLNFLRNLHLSSFLLLADTPFTSVQEVGLNRHGYHSNCHVLPGIASRFPKLKKLTNLCTVLQAEDMDRIVSYLRDVEELEIIVSDYGPHRMRFDFSAFICGISIDRKLTLCELADRVGIQTVLSWIDTPGPSLRDLKNLTKLKIRFHYTQKPKILFEIDEVGVYLTLLRLSPLLKLTFDGDFSISSCLAAKLTSYFKNIYFIPNKQ